MRETGLVSLIIPIWNPSIPQLKKCLESIKKQTYQTMESVFVVDCHSEESDQQVLSIIEGKDLPSAKIIIREKANGFTNALNEGIKESSGEYIARLDSDDVCHTERIRKQKEVLESQKYSIVGSWAKVIDEEDNILRLFQPPSSHEDIRKSIMKHNPIVHSSIMFTADAIEKMGMYDPRFDGSEDYELYLRALGRGFKIKNIPEFLVNIRESRDSIIRGARWKKTRRMYVKAKFRACRDYHFRTYQDIFFAVISPISLVITPRWALSAKALTSWYVYP